MNNNAQKGWGCCLALFIILLCLTALVGCGRKPLPTKETAITDTTTHNTTVNSQVNETTDRNRAIFDQLIATLGQIRTGDKNCDTICQEAMDNYLSQLNHVKQSGTNNYQLLYDKNQKQLKLIVELGETIDHLKAEKHDSIVYLDRLKTKTITETKYKVTDFWRYSAYLGWAFAAFLVFKASKKFYSWLNPTII
ncbi:hypothetical protein [Flavobacterium sp.]|uniref:hypothetical protein n=1 Tax=Flavobacterium sp. TaxID=239 RepID=UPI0040346C39